MKFFANVIQNAINIRIVERIRRENEGKPGWNAYYAALWHYFKINWLEKVQTDIDICFEFCSKTVESDKGSICKVIDRIVENGSFTGNDIIQLTSYTDVNDRNNRLYGKLQSKFDNKS
jgi:hypothetical protein